MDALRKIADAVLYEGYILWPYRRSALKNRQRFTFGGVYPRAHSEGRDDDPWQMRTEVLLEGGGDARVGVRVRFLHVVERRVGRQVAGGLEWVDELTVAGTRHLSWSEATEREVVAEGLELAALEPPLRVPIEVAAGSEEEELLEPTGERAGAVVRSWRELAGAVEIAAGRVRRGLFRLSVEVANTTSLEGADREDALRQTFCSTHTIVQAAGAHLVSQTDPPAPLAREAERCVNVGTWPVLVGEPGERHTMLSSPIILEDYPRIAPQSPGDLFDGGEIDQLLTLSILTLTEAERAEMRDSDPRAREILERTEALSEEELMRLHGAVHELRVARAR
jgi:hypothetical protein